MTTAGQTTADAIRKAATELFFEKGYDATTLRQVAGAVGLKVPSLYNHIGSKEDLLLQVMGGIMDDLTELQREAMQVEGDAVEMLRALVFCHIRFHAEHAKEVSIGNQNLRALPQDARDEVVAKRNAYEHNIQAAIEHAGQAELASVLDARMHTFSILGLGTSIASWYRPDGRLSLDDIITVYTKIALRELGVTDADQRVDLAMRGESSAHPTR